MQHPLIVNDLKRYVGTSFEMIFSLTPADFKAKMEGMSSIVFIFIFLFTGAQAGAFEADSQQMRELGQRSLSMIAASSAIVKAVREQNLRPFDLDAAKKMDEQWDGLKKDNEIVGALISNACATTLKKNSKSFAYIQEAFVMDKNGALVCMTNKTSDYWQGDEDKFKRAYADAKGSIFVDKVRFDSSAQSYVAQISVPVLENGKAIGAVTFGINVEKLK